MTPKRPAVLVILDGWGHSDRVEHNAIRAAASPVWDRLWQSCPRALLDCSGLAVGLPEGQMGNSEVGHMTLGAGRVIYQSLTRIDRAIATGEFFANPAYVQAVDAALAAGGKVHILGLLSPGGVHSHQEHLAAAVRLAARRGARRICVHAFLDGRDTPPQSAGESIRFLEGVLAEVGVGRIASLAGRYYAMDRDRRWERVQPVYEMLTEGVAPHRAASAAEGLTQAYDRGETDEFVEPTLIVPEGGEPCRVADGDAVLFMNFRPDRARQLTQAFVLENFDGFPRRRRPRLAAFVTTTEYERGLPVAVAFPPEDVRHSFGECLAERGLRQLRIAETEKYAHVTFFFSGGREAPFPGEDRILVDSPKVATYDLKPEMSAYEVTDRLVAAIEGGAYDALVCNFANGDMVGHTGVFAAAVKAVEAVDRCLGRIEAAVRSAGGQLLITADHGNVEQMVDPASGEPLTSHTLNPVPLVYVGPKRLRLAPRGTLADVAPTLLRLMGLEPAPEMSGRNLAAVE
ncbi:MAG: 2,3-bisphosphoglycerate-independent phosphoglycerate mutase [Porticoccaceae bacterium]|nr:MAG: 2,3-bisphosphoglycerate-independent phosphoglycerate mutase [Porticoccaceae bacterium]